MVEKIKQLPTNKLAVMFRLSSIVSRSWLSLCVLTMLPFQASAMPEVYFCKTSTVSAGGFVWRGESCFWGGGGSGGGGYGSGGDPFPNSGGGSVNSSQYTRNNFDLDGDHLIDCWKDIVKNGDHHLDQGDDFGPRIIGGQSDFHYGIDIQAPLGEIVRSPAFGKITKVERQDTSDNGAYIRMRFLQDGTLFEAVMLHMIAGSPNVSEGQTVFPGTPLGMVNSTGASTGNHLHFQLYIIDTPISPDGINPETRKPYNYSTLGPKTAVDPVAWMGNQSCSLTPN